MSTVALFIQSIGNLDLYLQVSISRCACPIFSFPLFNGRSNESVVPRDGILLLSTDVLLVNRSPKPSLELKFLFLLDSKMMQVMNYYSVEYYSSSWNDNAEIQKQYVKYSFPPTPSPDITIGNSLKCLYPPLVHSFTYLNTYLWFSCYISWIILYMPMFFLII